MLIQFNQYFENLATQHVDISHTSNNAREQGYFHSTMEAILGEMRVGITTPGSNLNTVLYLLLPNWSFDSDDNDVNYDFEMGFMVLSIAPNQSPMAILEAKDKALRVANEILMRIRHDVYTGTTSIFGDGFNLSSVQAIDAGQMLSNYHGYIVTFPVKVFNGICCDGSKWNDLPNQIMQYDE